jgi:hypothetical protein
MKLFNEKRVIIVHQRQIDLKGNITVGITESIHISDSVSFKLIRQDGTVVEGRSQSTPPPINAKHESKVEYNWHYNDFPEKDVVTLSKEYLKKLDRLVQECESIFPLH